MRYSVIVALTGLPIGYSVTIALTGLPIGYSVMVATSIGSPYRIQCNSSSNRSPYRIQMSVIVTLTGLPFVSLVDLLITGEGWAGTQFVHRHPSVLLHLLAFSVASALGQVSSVFYGIILPPYLFIKQNFIFLTIMSFGPLTLSLVTTTRKFFTILASVILFSNPLLWRQWMGVVLVFSGLAFDILFSKKLKK